jgi:NADP-dependent 3-hydroxy acid dehydrogenase YdfG
VTDPLAGKVVAITGASSGIGAATARLLAHRGARVAIGARRADRLVHLRDSLRADGAEVVHAVIDITRPEDAQRLVTTAVNPSAGWTCW